MNITTTLKRSLVIALAALVLAVPAAQAAHEPSQLLLAPHNSQPTAAAAQPTQAQLPPSVSENDPQWTNFAIGAVIVGIVFSVLYVGASRTQMPRSPRPQA